MKLFEVLKGQDFGQKEVERIAVRVLNDEPIADPITSIIVEAWKSAGGAEGEFDKDVFVNDIQYAIDQLKKVQLTIRP